MDYFQRPSHLIPLTALVTAILGFWFVQWIQKLQLTIAESILLHAIVPLSAYLILYVINVLLIIVRAPEDVSDRVRKLWAARIELVLDGKAIPACEDIPDRLALWYIRFFNLAYRLKLLEVIDPDHAKSQNS